MSKLTYALATMLAGIFLLSAPALAQSGNSSAEEGGGSIVMTWDNLLNDIQQLVTPFEGIVVLSVLPRGWDIGEQGVKHGSSRDDSELAENINRYVLVSRSPVVDENEAPDFTFELSIFKHGLFDEMPAGLSEEEQSTYEAEAFRTFLDIQISDALNAGLHCTSKAAEIKPMPYGTGTRPYTIFVPIYYETQGGAQIFTFTSAYNGKVWMMKFLIKEDQVENYGGLVAYILNNSFALTTEEFDEYNRQMAEIAAGQSE